MTDKQKCLIKALIDRLPENEKQLYREIINYLTDLGYIPQRKKNTDINLIFKHKQNGKIIMKMGVEARKGFIKVKFFACKDLPDKYIAALRDEAELNEERAARNKNSNPSLPVPPPDNEPMPPNTIMKKCTLLCSLCTGGGMRYYHKYPDNKEIFRCGAYPVLIPDITEKDLNDLKRLISEQHNYFLSIG
jgi:hypothetical protein